jgi:hypothetical protein
MAATARTTAIAETRIAMTDLSKIGPLTVETVRMAATAGTRIETSKIGQLTVEMAKTAVTVGIRIETIDPSRIVRPTAEMDRTAATAETRIETTDQLMAKTSRAEAAILGRRMAQIVVDAQAMVDRKMAGPHSTRVILLIGTIVQPRTGSRDLGERVTFRPLGQITRPRQIQALQGQ